MVEQLQAAIFAIIAALAVALAYFWGANLLLDRLLPYRDGDDEGAIRNQRLATAIRPWLFLGPALLALGIYLVYPVFETVRLSLHGRDGEQFVGLANYAWLVNDAGFRESMFNNFLWLLFVPALATFFGLVAAVLTDRVWWGNIAKSLVFMPMAISFVGASVIWKFVYDYRESGSEQIGILNAFVTWLGYEPQAWIAVPFWNNFFLMAILVWIQTGFAMVILSAALRGIPEETIEAAVIDGANGIQIFFRIMVPQIWGTIATVWTTITILVLKVFDIVFAMTNGQWNTQVLANYMYDWMFRGFDFGRGAAIAIVIMILVTPVMVWNIRRAAAETKGR
jgi:alpha-glucoside transport system permease protein